jgi:hypothetical protein
MQLRVFQDFTNQSVLRWIASIRCLLSQKRRPVMFGLI